MADITVATQLANMQIPESWANYVVQRAVEKDQFFTSGVIRPVPDLAQKLMANGGYVVNMPMFKALADVDPQIPDDTKDISLNAIQTDKAQARLFGYNQAWSATDLAAELTKTDPLEAIAESIGDYWRHINQKTLLTTLDGVFASESMKGINQFDATDGRTSKDATFSLKNFNRARFLLDDPPFIFLLGVVGTITLVYSLWNIQRFHYKTIMTASLTFVWLLFLCGFVIHDQLRGNLLSIPSMYSFFVLIRIVITVILKG